jgi:hypothetical protein
LDAYPNLFSSLSAAEAFEPDQQFIRTEYALRTRWKEQLTEQNVKRRRALLSGITNPDMPTTKHGLSTGPQTAQIRQPVVPLENPEKVTIDYIISTGASSINPTTHKVQHFSAPLLGEQKRATRMGCEAVRLSLLGLPLTKAQWLRLMVVGEGGSGKSVVANNIRRYAELNGRPELVIVMAMTAKAAQNVHGQTCDSVLGYNKEKISQASKKVWEHTCMGLLDEYSQFSLEYLGHLANRIVASEESSGRFANWESSDLLGHVHVILVGDQLQLPPVRGTPVYAFAEAIAQHGGLGRYIESAQCKKSAALMLGRHIYDLFENVIQINGPNYRFKNDHTWLHFTRRVRYAYSEKICAPEGRTYWMEHDVRLHNSRVLDGPEEGAPQSSDPNWTRAPLVTHDNLTRLTFGNYRTIARAKHSNTKAIGYRTVDYDGDSGRPLCEIHPRLATYLHNVDKPANMAHDFMFAPGINVSPPKNTEWGKFLGVINGANLVMKHIALDPREPQAPMLGEPRYDPDVHWLQYPPLYIICLVVDLDIQLDGLPHGCVPIYYDPNHSYRWKLGKTQQAFLSNLRGKPVITIKIKRANIPALCVEGKTSYGVQGSQFTHVIGMWPKGSGNLVASKMYTILSRPTGSKAYATLTRITEHDFARLYVPKDILAEERRLHRLAAITRVRYAHLGDAPSDEDHRIARQPAPIPATPYIPPPRSPRPDPQATTTGPHTRKRPLAQEAISKSAGIQATLHKRAKGAPATTVNPP